MNILFLAKSLVSTSAIYIKKDLQRIIKFYTYLFFQV